MADIKEVILMSDRVRRDGATIDADGEVDPVLPGVDKVDDMNRADQWRFDLETKSEQIKKLNDLSDKATALSSEVIEITQQILGIGFPAGEIVDRLKIAKRCEKVVDAQVSLNGALNLSAELVIEKLKSALDDYPEGIDALELMDLKLKYLSDFMLPVVTAPDNGTDKKTSGKKAVSKKKK